MGFMGRFCLLADKTLARKGRNPSASRYGGQPIEAGPLFFCEHS